MKIRDQFLILTKNSIGNLDANFHISILRFEQRLFISARRFLLKFEIRSFVEKQLAFERKPLVMYRFNLVDEYKEAI